MSIQLAFHCFYYNLFVIFKTIHADYVNDNNNYYI